MDSGFSLTGDRDGGTMDRAIDGRQADLTLRLLITILDRKT